MRVPLFALFLAACGPSGSFTLPDRSYNADQIRASLMPAPPEGKIGIDVELKSDPVAAAIDDEVSVRVTLLWDAESPPPKDRDLSIGDGVIIALARIGCFCGGKDTAFTEPTVSGKVRFSEIDPKKGIKGDFDLSFKGQIALTQGGVIYDDATLKARATGFAVK